MRTLASLILVGAALVAGGCGGGGGGNAGGDGNLGAAGTAAGVDSARGARGADGAHGAAPAPGGPGGPGAAPSAGAPQDPGSPEAAAAVIRDYYAAIAARDFARAYGYWADQGAASGQSFDAFRRGFARTATVRAEVGRPGRIEGAAGSRYITVPVEIRATTTDGAAQCFRGSYTLRRAVVPGASAELRRWHIHSADIARCGAGSGDAGAAVGAPPAADVAPPGAGGGPGVSDPAARAAADLVRRFGGRLSRVSLLAPPAELRRSIRDAYGPFVTAPLLEAWLRDPSTAPGREVSSPWPDRIEVRAVRRVGPGEYEVTGDVVYVTSVEAAGGGAARRERVALAVVRAGDGEWRIAGYARS